jgi:hypothetical protein
VTVTGSIDLSSFAVAQLEFAYASDPTNTWFNIRTLTEPVTESILAVWDTRSITDGAYILRLRATLADGTSQEVTVPIAVLNDVPEATPTAVPPTATTEFGVLIPTPFLLAASPTPTDQPRPTPTALPPNPASLEQSEIYLSLGRGALVMMGLFAIGGLIVRLRRF